MQTAEEIPTVKQRHVSLRLVLHCLRAERTVQLVRTRGKQDWETAARRLFQAVKDHNPTMQEMVDVSNTYCYRNAPA